MEIHFIKWQPLRTLTLSMICTDRLVSTRFEECAVLNGLIVQQALPPSFQS